MAQVGFSSTRPGFSGETGIDTLRLLFETERSFKNEIVEAEGWRFGSIEGLGLTWAEGRPCADRLARSEDVLRAGSVARAFVERTVGVRRDRGVARVDITTTRTFASEPEARAFLAGMAALDLPRCETIRRGRPVHSVAWSHAVGRRILARCYDKGLERRGEPWRHVRLEDQRRFRAGARPTLEAVADPTFQRELFERRFRPMASAAKGVTAATFPFIAQSIADEFRWGLRSRAESERLAASLVLLGGGAGDAYSKATAWRRRREMQRAGYVLVDDERDGAEVELSSVLEAALEEFESDGVAA
ncbi:MAG: hypothetical protein ACYDA3_01940 [Gaiellaceae bacterium]